MHTLVNAAALLSCFGAEAPTLSAGEAAQRLGLPKPAVSRLMKRMREAGFLEPVGNTRRLRPGRMLHERTAAFRASSRLLVLAREEIETVCARSGHTGFVAMLDGANVTSVHCVPGTSRLHIRQTVTHMPASRSATGRTLLARLGDEEVRLRHASLSDSDLAALVARLDVLRDEGYEVSRAEVRRGVDVVAAAVSDPVSGDTVSLAAIFPVSLRDRERNTTIDCLLRAAWRLAAAVGDEGFLAVPDSSADTAA